MPMPTLSQAEKSEGAETIMIHLSAMAHGEGIVQTTNIFNKDGDESRSGKLIRRSWVRVPVVPPFSRSRQRSLV